MNIERKTLAEFSRAYLRSLEVPAMDEKDYAEHAFAAHIVMGMNRAKLILVEKYPTDSSRTIPQSD